jgi:hypothetical protein
VYAGSNEIEHESQKEEQKRYSIDPIDRPSYIRKPVSSNGERDQEGPKEGGGNYDAPFVRSIKTGRNEKSRLESPKGLATRFCAIIHRARPTEPIPTIVVAGR